MKIETSTGSVRFLKPNMLKGDTAAIIERVEEKMIHNPYKGEEEAQVVTYFTIIDEPDQLASMICNKTVQRQLVAALGSDETQDWHGQKVVLFPTVASNGKPAIRVKSFVEVA